MSPTAPSDAAHSPACVLVIDDEPDLRELYELALMRAGYSVYTAASVTAAREAIARRSYDAVITDMRLSDGSGLDVLTELQKVGRNERAIVITAYGSAENAVEALKAGAFDYIGKPVDLQQLRNVLAAAIHEHQLQLQLQNQLHLQSPDQVPDKAPTVAQNLLSPRAQQALTRIEGSSHAIVQLRQQIAKAARGMAPILIRGESGTGKELTASAIHACSQRAQGPFVAVNCGAIPENLLEAEFFGARKGSYTGAGQDRPGYFQAAHGGTLFLDEIGDLPLGMQAKLLRAIQERCVRPLGSTKEEMVDVRIVSATHHDLGAAVQTGRFRQDLYYRLNVIELLLPPLRERREDIPQLAAVLLEKIARESGLELRPLSQNALTLLMEHPLSGNVRELENLLQRSLAMSEGKQLEMEPDTPHSESSLGSLGPLESNAGTQPTHLLLPETPTETISPFARLQAPNSSPGSVPLSSTAEPESQALAPLSIPSCPNPLPHDLQAWMDAVERQILIRALKENRYNRTAAANRLGISLRQMRYRIQQLQIDSADE